VRAGAILLVALTIIVLPLHGDEAETRQFLLDAFTDTPTPAKQQWLAEKDATNEARLVLALAYAFYRNLLSSQDGDRCGFSLSCSRYAKLAIERYGLLRGMVMAADRLQRCHGRGGSYYPRDRVTGRLYDPVP
jgi:putative component of membrane protein insertase Oxa1/YidC/SpoIIIJ protein YidD